MIIHDFSGGGAPCGPYRAIVVTRDGVKVHLCGEDDAAVMFAITDHSTIIVVDSRGMIAAMSTYDQEGEMLAYGVDGHWWDIMARALTERGMSDAVPDLLITEAAERMAIDP